MALHLSEEQIRQRLVRLANLERMHAHDREQVAQLKAANKQLRSTVAAQVATIAGLQTQVADLSRAVTKLTDSGNRYRFYLFGQDKAGGQKKDGKTSRKHPKRAAGTYARPVPSAAEITNRRTLSLTVCPACSGAVSDSVESYTHYVEDIVFTPKTVTEYTIHRHWCRNCHKLVRPAVPDCLPGMRLGLNTVLFVLVEHYRSRKTDEQIVDSLARYFGLKISDGELSEIRHLAADYFGDTYDAILKAIRSARLIYADETGWHILGKKAQCWNVTAPEVPAVLYQLAGSRGKDEIQGILGLEDGRKFQGVIVSDFYSGYDGLSEEQQKCWVHLLRDTHLLARGSLDTHTKTTSQAASSRNQAERTSLHEQLTAIYRKIAAFQQEDWAAPAAHVLEQKLDARLVALAGRSWQDNECERIAKRLAKYRRQLLTCVRIPGVLPENNTAERSIRPVVVQRKITGGSRSQKGADSYSVNKSVIETARLEGGDFVAKLKSTLHEAAWRRYFSQPHRLAAATTVAGR